MSSQASGPGKKVCASHATGPSGTSSRTRGFHHREGREVSGWPSIAFRTSSSALISSRVSAGLSGLAALALGAPGARRGSSLGGSGRWPTTRAVGAGGGCALDALRGGRSDAIVGLRMRRRNRRRWPVPRRCCLQWSSRSNLRNDQLRKRHLLSRYVTPARARPATRG